MHRTLVFMVILAGGCLLWYELAGPGYYSELNAIRGDLQKMPEVENVDLRWVDVSDIPFLYTLDHISARIRVAGKGEIMFASINEDSTRSTKHLYLSSVGPFRIRFRGEGNVGHHEAATGKSMRSEFAGCNPDIGTDGDFAHLLPFEIPNLQTAIARYDEILKKLEALAATPSQARFFQDAEGTFFYYWVVTNDGDGSEDPLWNQPLSTLRENAVPSEAF